MLEELSVRSKLEEQHRQGAGVQALPSDYITPPVALVQNCSGRGAVGSSSREAEEHLSGMQVALYNNIEFDSCQNHTGAIVRFIQGHLSGWGPTQGQLSIHTHLPEVSRSSKVS